MTFSKSFNPVQPGDLWHDDGAQIHWESRNTNSFSPDGKSVLFNSMRLGDPIVNFGGVLMGASMQLYRIPVQGGRERLEIPLPALDVAPSPDGRIYLYTNFKSSESEWRKHAVSEATRDIWLYDSKDATHRHQ